MTLQVPRLPFSLDPPIAEAKRRARQRQYLLGLGGLLLFALAGGLTLALRSSGGGSSGFALNAGQTRTFGTAQTADRITCRSNGYSVTVAVPPPREGAFKQTTVIPTRRLAINVGRKVDGRVWALCRWR